MSFWVIQVSERRVDGVLLFSSRRAFLDLRSHEDRQPGSRSFYLLGGYVGLSVLNQTENFALAAARRPRVPILGSSSSGSFSTGSQSRIAPSAPHVRFVFILADLCWCLGAHPKPFQARSFPALDPRRRIFFPAIASS